MEVILGIDYRIMSYKRLYAYI